MLLDFLFMQNDHVLLVTSVLIRLYFYTHTIAQTPILSVQLLPVMPSIIISHLHCVFAARLLQFMFSFLYLDPR